MLCLDELIIQAFNKRNSEKFSQADLSYIASSDSSSFFTKYREQVIHPVLSSIELTNASSLLKNFKRSVLEKIQNDKAHRFVSQNSIAISYSDFLSFLEELNKNTQNQEVFLNVIFRLGDYQSKIMYSKALKFISQDDYKDKVKKIILFNNLLPLQIKGMTNSFDADLTFETNPLILFQNMYLKEKHYIKLHEKISSILEKFREDIDDE
jgi:hypothetical protein